MAVNYDNATIMLNQWQKGDEQALEQLIPIVYGELKRLAKAQLNRDHKAQIQCTELISEAYLKLVNVNEVDFKDRNHFFSIAAKTMRQVLVDQFRYRSAAKRGSEPSMMTYVDEGNNGQTNSIELDKLEDALLELESLDARQAEIVTLRFFGGLKNVEIGELMGVSERTIKREWAMAKLWLHQSMNTS